jgi:MoaA/NifB/PqqE/SkfB family radical SAM enzyme
MHEERPVEGKHAGKGGALAVEAGTLPVVQEGQPKLQHIPRCLYLEITDKCNMNCPMCITHDYRKSANDPLLTSDDVSARLLRPFRQLGGKHFVVSGGEPMLSPILMEVLSEADGLGYNITFASNILSEALHSFKDILVVLDDARHGFQFSFDSVIAEEMNAVRGKDVYCKVLGNLSKITQLRHQHGYKARLFAQVVVQDQNLESVIETIDFLVEDVGVDGCSIQPEVNYQDVTLENLRSQVFPSTDGERRSRYLNVARQLFERAAYDKRVLIEGETYENWEKFFTNPLEIEGPCNSRNMVMVGAYGDLRGCLFSPTTDNILRTSLNEYLRSESYKRFLKLAEVCKICINGCA